MILNRDPICVLCDREPSAEVDHIKPKANGGEDTEENLQGVCRSCHASKTGREKRFGASDRKHNATVVCGPPASGKSTYVRERAVPGDLIIDIDLLLQAISGMPKYEAPDALLPFAMEARAAIVRRLATGSGVKHVWYMATAPEAEERERLARTLQADVIVLAVSEAECIRRIEADDTRQCCASQQTDLVRQWWATYQP